MSSSEQSGYRLNVGVDQELLSTDLCERPVWEDHDHCIWHAPADGKTVNLLENEDQNPGENLDGAYLKDAWSVGIDWFAGRSLVGANLTGAQIMGANFTNTDLTLATLAETNAINTEFDRANLAGVIFTNADLRRTIPGLLLVRCPLPL